MATEDGSVSFALTPVQLFAMLNGRSISPGELASNTWHEMPSPSSFSQIEAFLKASPSAPSTAQGTLGSARQDAWSRQTHYSQPSPPGCWTPPPVRAPSGAALNRGSAVLSIVGGGVETVGGVLLVLAPDPTLITKVGGSALALHGVDTTQAAVRQLFSGKPVADFTQTGATWAAREMGATDRSAHRIGVVLDVAVPFAVGAGMLGAEKVIAVRSGRVVLSEQAIEGQAGRVSLDLEEADKAAGKEGGHTLKKHVDVTDADIRKRALANPAKDVVISRFASKEIAETAINDAIKAQRSAMQKWAANPALGTTAQDFHFDAGRPIGTAYVKATDTFQQATKLKVVLATARRGGKLYYILTAYPEL